MCPAKAYKYVFLLTKTAYGDIIILKYYDYIGEFL